LNKKIKVGIIGCGNIALTKHIPSLSRLENVEIVAFQDLNIESAKKARAGSRFKNAFVFTDYEILLEEDLDVVHICTPNNTHAEIAIHAMKKGKHVMCEKPMATRVKDAEEMVKVSKETGMKLSISMQNRFRRDSLVLKEMCENGVLGDIYFSKAHATRRRAVPVWGKFLDKDYQGGGPLIDIGVHALDLTLWLMDNFKPKSIMGTTYRELGSQEGLFNSLGSWDPDKFTVEDSGFGFIVMENGATVVLESSWALNALDVKEAKCTLCGSKAGADMNNGLTLNGDRDGYLFETKARIDKKDLEYYDDEKDTDIYTEAESWIKAIVEDKEPVVSASEGLVVLKIVEGLYQSAETGMPVIFE
jgi:predicted dehydrogenase